jgi:hypothetical protein
MYTVYYPSGRLFEDGVLIDQVDGNPPYDAYVLWLQAGNGPDLLPDPPEPEPTATVEQIAAAMQQLGVSAVDHNQMNNSVFPLAVTL